MPERFSTPGRPGDLTGQIAHRLWVDKQKQVERDLERQREEINQAQAEAAESVRVPVAYETFTDYVDYTTPNAAHQPINAPRG